MFYLGQLTTLVPRDKRDPAVGRAHLEWLDAETRTGRLALSGRLPSREDGMYLIRADSREEAEQVATEDPATIAGYTACELLEWDVRRGAVLPLRPEDAR